jgi:hypothetical protein
MSGAQPSGLDAASVAGSQSCSDSGRWSARKTGRSTRSGPRRADSRSTSCVSDSTCLAFSCSRLWLVSSSGATSSARSRISSTAAASVVLFNCSVSRRAK